jgi:hypothetical protein
VAVKRRLDRGSKAEHGTRHLQLDVFKLGRCYTLAEWSVENIQETQGHV